MARVRVPDSMASMMTFELAELLGQLRSQQQIDAIERIVMIEGHLVDNPPAPYSLIRTKSSPKGGDYICSDTTWTSRGIFNEKTGKWKRIGWTHQKTFMEALSMAKRLARTARLREQMGNVQDAVAYARSQLMPLMEEMVGIGLARGELLPSGDYAGRDVKAGEQVQAAKLIFGIGMEGVGASDSTGTEGGDDMAADWWKAAEED